jgi:hypothetical protein
MIELIKKILKESREEINVKLINIVLDNLNSGMIKPPYFKNLEDLGLSDKEIELTLEEFTGGKVFVTNTKIIHKKYGTDVYNEWGDNHWAIREYNKFGDITKILESEGYWEKREYDDRGNEIYREDSNGFWFKQEWDDNDNEIYFENSNGTWIIREYDKDNKLVYEESNKGVNVDER